MTLRELYDQIGGSYEQAVSVLHVEKLMDKHIRKFPKSGVVDALLEAGQTMDSTRLFEAAHAMKGVCANLGLTKLAAISSDMAEEFRPGHDRTLSDEVIHERLEAIGAIYEKTVACIDRYEGA